jgi:hypothetical protein
VHPLLASSRQNSVSDMSGMSSVHTTTSNRSDARYTSAAMALGMVTVSNGSGSVDSIRAVTLAVLSMMSIRLCGFSMVMVMLLDRTIVIARQRVLSSKTCISSAMDV